ncbi:MAG: hypothetical protein HYV19_06400 [Gemmatimonadetes bacterium]|nr:hypothetical protein [Gemmatimonadota bacterium]
MLEHLLPESLFPRKLAPAAERRMRLAQARAEEALVRTHVENALTFVDALAEELPFDRAIDTYIRELAVPEPLASVVVTRVLVVLGRELLPRRRHEAADEERPRLRLSEASTAKKGDVRRA